MPVLLPTLRSPFRHELRGRAEAALDPRADSGFPGLSVARGPFPGHQPHVEGPRGLQSGHRPAGILHHSLPQEHRLHRRPRFPRLSLRASFGPEVGRGIPAHPQEREAPGSHRIHLLRPGIWQGGAGSPEGRGEARTASHHSGRSAGDGRYHASCL